MLPCLSMFITLAMSPSPCLTRYQWQNYSSIQIRQSLKPGYRLGKLVAMVMYRNRGWTTASVYMSPLAMVSEHSHTQCSQIHRRRWLLLNFQWLIWWWSSDKPGCLLAASMIEAERSGEQVRSSRIHFITQKNTKSIDSGALQIVYDVGWRRGAWLSTSLLRLCVPRIREFLLA